MAVSKNAKFFCENCGAEVPQNAKMCRHCGRFFSSVRCPQCSATGTPDKFSNGCPVCGYAFNKDSKQTSSKKIKQEKTSGKNRKIRKELAKLIENKEEIRVEKTDETLPKWIYFVAAGLLAAIIAVFAGYCKI